MRKRHVWRHRLHDDEIVLFISFNFDEFTTVALDIFRARIKPPHISATESI